MISSCIVTSHDLEFAKNDVLSKIDSKFIKTYFVDEFKVDDAKEVLREAYIAEDSQKFLVICALNYNVYAQNALLKLLEEPPKDINFILIAKSKTSLLPTIRSRMTTTHLNNKKDPYALGLNFSNMSLSEIFGFLKNKQHISKDEHKEIIEAILLEVSKSNIPLTASELDMFDICLDLAQLNSRSQNTLSYLLLTVMQAKARM
jgi:DNA polymerase-3 subunit delta'